VLGSFSGWVVAFAGLANGARDGVASVGGETSVGFLCLVLVWLLAFQSFDMLLFFLLTLRHFVLGSR